MKIPALGHEEFFRIRTFEIDSHKQVTLPALVQLMQEAAMQNVIMTNLSIWDLEPYKISWVLMRKNTTIHRLPLLGEKIRVLTYPTGFEKFFTYRDYHVFAENGECLAYSSSTWLLMDTEKRRMARIPDFIKAHAAKLRDNDAISLPRLGLKLDFKFEKSDRQQISQVHYFDLDFNNHLGNVHYLSRALNVIDTDFLNTHQIQNMDILYRAEATLGEQIISELQQIDDTTFLHLLRTEDGKELMTAKTSWRAEMPQ